MKETKWDIIANRRPGMVDGVELTKKKGYYSIYRYVNDWDEDGDTICDEEEILNMIPEEDIKKAIGASSDSDVVDWVKNHIGKRGNNSIDEIIGLLGVYKVKFTREFSRYPL